MLSSPKSRSRRTQIRENRPDADRFDWQRLSAAGVPASVGIAAAFFVVATAILFLRQDVIPYRPDQPINHDIVARVGFNFSDPRKFTEAQRRAQEAALRVYQPNDGEPWASLEKELLALPDRVAAAGGEVPPDAASFASASLTQLRRAAASREGREVYEKDVHRYIESLRGFRAAATHLPLILLRGAERQVDVQARRKVLLDQEPVDPRLAYSIEARDELSALFSRPVKETFIATLQGDLLTYTLDHLKPTHVLDESATIQRQTEAASAVPPDAGRRTFRANEVLVRRSDKLSEADWQLLRAEHAEYLASVQGADWKGKVGIVCLALIVTVVLSAYIVVYQPRVLKNHMRALAIAALLVSMLLLAALAGIGNGPLYLFGLAPTILVALILAIVYDQRFAIGVASMHGLLATVALSQGVSFFVILWVGVLMACFLMDDIRTRSKLIEVGGATAMAMMAATAAAGLLALESPAFILRNCLYAGAAGLAVGFIVLGTLPFVERFFRITTSMTLLELADTSHPLLRRLQLEAPGTFSHSLQVASLSEAAAEAIGANSLLCRVGAYYHDVGKINKADYFIENQTGGESRHFNLNPSVSYYIITSHVKDGIELAKEYHLPPSLIPFIQQHHGTTLVEYFYRQACQKQQACDPSASAPAEHEFRYAGPKPRSKEAAVLMIADAVESATRSMKEPTSARVEDLVRDLALKRLLDEQFNECDLTTRDLDLIRKSLVKSILSIHHGRIAYPSTSATTHPASASPSPTLPIAPVQSA